MSRVNRRAFGGATLGALGATVLSESASAEPGPRDPLPNVRWGQHEISRLLVGHNPGIADLAEWLATGDDSPAHERLRRGFPPAALAVLSLDVPGWSATSPRCAHLTTFTTPADLGVA